MHCLKKNDHRLADLCIAIQTFLRLLHLQITIKIMNSDKGETIASCLYNNSHPYITIVLYDKFFRMSLHEQISSLIHEYAHCVLMETDQMIRTLVTTNEGMAWRTQVLEKVTTHLEQILFTAFMDKMNEKKLWDSVFLCLESRSRSIEPDVRRLRQRPAARIGNNGG